MAHGKLTRMCQQCQKTLRVDTLTDTCPSGPPDNFVDGCSDMEYTAVGYCPICLENTNQTVSVVHSKGGDADNDPNEDDVGEESKDGPMMLSDIAYAIFGDAEASPILLVHVDDGYPTDGVGDPYVFRQDSHVS